MLWNFSLVDNVLVCSGVAARRMTTVVVVPEYVDPFVYLETTPAGQVKRGKKTYGGGGGLLQVA